jgi:hypothetical protein
MSETDWPAATETYAMGVVHIRSRATGPMPSAPEFGEDGAWPPVATEWVPQRWELFESATNERTTVWAYELIKAYRSSASARKMDDFILTRDDLSEEFIHGAIQVRQRVPGILFDLEGHIQYQMPNGEPVRYRENMALVTSFARPPVKGAPAIELRRVVYAARWQRQDPVTQLPPGSTLEVTHSVTAGLTVERSQTLAKSLGLNIGENAPGIQARLSSQLNEEFGLRLDITTQEERARNLTLTNQNADHYRLFALWHVDQRITIDALDIPMREHPYFATWAPRGDIELVTADGPVITCAEKEIRHP